VPSLALHAAHHYWQCALLQHSIAIILYACRQQSSFTVHNKQALSVRRDDPKKKSEDGQAKFHQSFSHFIDISQPKSGVGGFVGEMRKRLVKCERNWSQDRLWTNFTNLFHRSSHVWTGSESGIPLFRLTVTPLAIFGDGNKVRQGNKVVAPEDNFNSAKHSERTPARGICKWMDRTVALA
jgi:hypothetical protein